MKIIFGLVLMLATIFSVAATIEAQTSKVKTIQVNISKNGYSPAALTVKKGRKIRLLLTRTDSQNCGGEIVFSSLNIRKNLPVGKTVAVEFTPTDAGEINFTCGMGMYKGKILVQ